jgi:hypothetical protein
VEIDGETEYEISKILDSKIDNRRRHCKLLYLVRWEGYEGTNEETSWMLASELDHADATLNRPRLKYDLPNLIQSLESNFELNFELLTCSNMF